MRGRSVHDARVLIQQCKSLIFPLQCESDRSFLVLASGKCFFFYNHMTGRARAKTQTW